MRASTWSASGRVEGDVAGACTNSTTMADSTAAAGAQGAEIKRGVPPNSDATSPMTTAPSMPDTAPTAA